MCNSCSSAFTNTGAWEQQERNKNKETEEEGKKRGLNIWKEVQGIRKKARRPNYSLGLPSPRAIGSLLPEAVDELPIESFHGITPGGIKKKGTIACRYCHPHKNILTWNLL